ncbi:MAG: coproporphyrinogen dehydrogenase HemZ [Oscillospiraceae bacterium]|jgi:oxygen-independent coproporphyrinogen-3 oxidase|nr:coproporphyrinogen dehydrogenase HemZ [Oscillospiraceae bacterium]
MRLIGHDYKYAVEQTAISLFGGAVPEFDSELRFGDNTVRTRIYGSEVAEDITGLPPAADTREIQRALKLSFYRAAVKFLPIAPAWGAVSGVKPTRLALLGIDLEREFYVSPERAELVRSTAKFAGAADNALAENDVVLYVGIPFCPTRCSYCSFVSVGAAGNNKLIEPYIAALNREIAIVSRKVAESGERVRAVYIGGGTPTTLSAGQLGALLQELRISFDLSACDELTVEAGRPDTITLEKLIALRDGGVTRVSVNPQTMNDEVLRKIGRLHSAEDSIRAFRLVREVGFRQVNMDLIAGLPVDTAESFRNSVDICLELKPDNLTLHTLTLKKGSAMREGSAQAEISPQLVGDMLGYAFGKLKSRGYEPYYLYRQKYSAGFENSGWTLPGSECLYNVVMMEELRTVYALGAGGSTKRVIKENGEFRASRSFNKKYHKEYIESMQ